MRNRGLALAIGLLGTGITGALMPSLAAWLIGEFGWRGAMLGISLLPLCIGLPIAYWLVREPLPPGGRESITRWGNDVAALGHSFGAAPGEPRFWMMIASFGFVALAFGGLFTNYYPLLTDKGFDVAKAALVTGAIGLSILGGRLLAGLLIDRFWAPAVAFPMLAAPALACWLLTHDVVSTPVAVLAAVLIGFAAGAESDLIAFMAAKYFGLKHSGKVSAAL